MSELFVSKLDAIPREYVGAYGGINCFFVSNSDGHVDTISFDFDTAYRRWKELASVRPLQECTLEDCHTGVLACVEPRDYPTDKTPIVVDDTRMLQE